MQLKVGQVPPNSSEILFTRRLVISDNTPNHKKNKIILTGSYDSSTMVKKNCDKGGQQWKWDD